MRLHSISLENFKSFRDEAAIPLSQITCLIGPNGAGKSNILHGLNALSAIIRENDYTPEAGDYFNSDTTQEMKLTAVMELSDDERHMMASRIRNQSSALSSGDLPKWLFKRLKYEASFSDASEARKVSLTFMDDAYHTFASVRRDGDKYTAKRRSVNMIHMIGKTLPELQSHDSRSTSKTVLLAQIDAQLVSRISEVFSGIMHTTTQRGIPTSTDVHESHGITPDGSDILNELNTLPREKQLEFDRFLSAITDRSISSIEPTVRGSKLVLEAVERGLDRKTPHTDFGSGQEQLVLLALQLFTMRGTLFMLSEPELHLHAKAQKRIREGLTVAGSRLQIVMETHSPIFLGTDEGEGVLLITKDGGHSHVTPIGPGNMDVIRHELGVAHGDSLYHENILFVEGDSEHAAFPAFMSALGHYLAPRTTVFNLGGVGRIKHLPLLLRYFKADGRRVFVILDDNDAARAHTKNLKDGGLDKNFIILEKNFEDAFASATIMDAVTKMAAQHGCKFSLTATDLDAERAKGRRVDAILQEHWRKETGHGFNKVDLAKLLAGLPKGDIPDEIKSALQAAADHFGRGGDGKPAEGGDTGGENPA